MSIKSIVQRAKHALVFLATLIAWPIVSLLPRNRKKVVFGAWWGNQFSDNPKYFMEYLYKSGKGYELYWAGDETVRPLVEQHGEAKFVRKDSLACLWHVLTSGYLCFNISVDYDISKFPTYNRQKLINFWHGTAYKGATFRGSAKGERAGRGAFRKVRTLVRKFMEYAYSRESYSSFSCPAMIDMMPYECPGVFVPEKSAAFGTPRIDYLVCNGSNQTEISRVRKKYSQMLGLPLDRKWYLYMPTWRKGLDVKFSFARSPRQGDYNSVLDEQSAIIVEKQHPQVVDALGLKGGRSGNIYTISKESSHMVDVQELLLAADRLITDYSSCFCDYGTLKRPIIHYAYDYEWYRDVERGVEYELEDVAGGPISYTEDELAGLLGASDEMLLAGRAANADKLISAENGKASETFAKWIGMM